MRDLSLTVPASGGYESFLYSPVQTDLDRLDAHVAIMGMPYGSAYDASAISNDQIHAPDAVRSVTDRVCRSLERYDYDVATSAAPSTEGEHLRSKVVDIGNVLADFTDLQSHYKRAEQAIRKVFSRGALPITIGGDHGITTPRATWLR